MTTGPKSTLPTGSVQPTNTDDLVSRLEILNHRIKDARHEIGQVVFGQEDVIEQSLACLLAGGHGLLVGVPGLAKTRLVQALGVVMGLDTKRVQFTPDLMPSDILGSEILEDTQSGGRAFRFLKGPVFCQLFMADEINRASPRTQSALLEAMQEHKVTIAGDRHDLGQPFHVIATQNPLEQEGTYPLPEAQLDRFLLQIEVQYPSLEAERQMLLATTGAENYQAKPILNVAELLESQSLVRRLPVGEKVLEGILRLVRAGRPEESEIGLVKANLDWGPGPRAAQALMLAAKARAFMDGRLTPSLDDVSTLAAPVLRHRMGLKYSARVEGITMTSIIDELVGRTL